MILRGLSEAFGALYNSLDRSSLIVGIYCTPDIFAAMSFELFTELPKWFILLCILLGALYSGGLYFRNRRNPRVNSKVFLYLLSVLRFASATLLAILLLNPLLKYMDRDIQKPQVILAVDNSSSMVQSRDSALVRDNLPKVALGLEENLKDKFEVIRIQVGEGVELNESVDFSQKRSDLESVIAERHNLFSRSRGRGIILLSDGIYNSGKHPGYAALKSDVPVHTIGFGDTTMRRDLSVQDVRMNAITFLGNEFPVEIDVLATKAESVRSEVSIWSGGSKLGSETVVIEKDPFTRTVRFNLNASQAGSNDFVVRFAPAEGEYNLRNNTAYAATEVIDGRQRILISAHAPHPDIAALRSLIEAKDQYEVDVRLGDLSSVDKDRFDLVITHQMPTNGMELDYLKGLRDRQIPMLNILGTATSISHWNSLGADVTIQGNNRNYNQAQGSWNRQFDLFELDDENSAFLNTFPPLIVPFGQYQSRGNGHTALLQKIGQVKTQMPLLVLSKADRYKRGVFCGEGLWRWKLYEFEERENNEVFSDFFSKLVQFLALKEDSRKFRVFPSKRNLFENEQITFRAEVYNDNYEAVNKNNVELIIRNDSGEVFNYNFVPRGRFYHLEPGSLPPGSYSFTAKTTMAGRALNAAGSFIVKPLVIEQLRLTADHKMLRQVAENSNGLFAYPLPDDVSRIVRSLVENGNSESVVRSYSTFKDIIDMKWLFYLIFGLLALEWGMRRWAGSY